MHKRFFNEAVIELTIAPTGPVLIKAGESADPTRPDMSFVRTIRNGGETVYLPGSSLKGVLRSHCERLARTVRGKGPLACNPLREEDTCVHRMEKEKKERSAAEKYRESCFLCRLFGNTVLASHFRVSDAYPTGECRVEERNGVAIDRVYGSVAHGPFNYETVTAGSFAAGLNLFKTTLRVKNFTLAQLGLLALTLRDISSGQVRMGFAKSRGLGLVTVRVDAMTLRYPLCETENGKLRLIDGREIGDDNRLYGAGEFVRLFPEDDDYGYAAGDHIPLNGYGYEANDWGELEVHVPKAGEEADWKPLARECAKLWRKEVVNDGRNG